MAIQEIKRSTRNTLINILKKPNLWLLFDAFRWHIIDKLRWQPGDHRVSGLNITIGKTGSGKTLNLCRVAAEVRKKYPGDAISTNFFWSGQDFALEDYHQIDDLYDGQPVWFFIDEIQKTFAASNYKNFPPTLFDVLSEARKLNIRIEATSQYTRFVDNKFREYAHTITEVTNLFGWSRLFRTKTFDKDDWTRKDATKDNQFPPKLDPLKTEWWVASDDIYSMYDTHLKTKAIRQESYQPDYSPYSPGSDSLPHVQIVLPKR
jgi:hypothetical protein